jgi:hypothetical protein
VLLHAIRRVVRLLRYALRHVAVNVARLHPCRVSCCSRRGLSPCIRLAPELARLATIGVLAASSAAPPSRRYRKHQRPAKAQGKIKGRGTSAREKPVCTWGWYSTRQEVQRAVMIRNAASVLTKLRASCAGLRRCWMYGSVMVELKSHLPAFRHACQRALRHAR